ncbi:MAG TPA: hypothetical protein P5263_10465 [Methanoregulaceae archaeon]|nr:hypothetical protein [Methanoregulaceae archaeon]
MESNEIHADRGLPPPEPLQAISGGRVDPVGMKESISSPREQSPSPFGHPRGGGGGG